MLPSASLFLARQIDRLRQLPRKRIVFPEGPDVRVQAAAKRLKSEDLIEPILLDGDVDQAARLVAGGRADGAVGGAVNTTAETARAAIRAIGPRPGVRRISGVFFMCVADRNHGHDGVLAFADCALLIDPTAEEIAEIAILTAHSTRTIIGAEPRVALLSFSTRGSARHVEPEKMIEALRILRERAPDLNVDGEMQADAALVPSVGASKFPGSNVAGRANTLIFPNLSSANIGYKLVERLGGAAAYGPLLQGLAKPMNDLSRGCSEHDIYGTAILTALQAQ